MQKNGRKKRISGNIQSLTRTLSVFQGQEMTQLSSVPARIM